MDFPTCHHCPCFVYNQIKLLVVFAGIFEPDVPDCICENMIVIILGIVLVGGICLGLWKNQKIW